MTPLVALLWQGVKDQVHDQDWHSWLHRVGEAVKAERPDLTEYHRSGPESVPCLAEVLARLAHEFKVMTGPEDIVLEQLTWQAMADLLVRPIPPGTEQFYVANWYDGIEDWMMARDEAPPASGLHEAEDCFDNQAGALVHWSGRKLLLMALPLPSDDSPCGSTAAWIEAWLRHREVETRLDMSDDLRCALARAKAHLSPDQIATIWNE